MSESKNQVTVTLEVREIVYDIQNKTFLTGRSREAQNSKNYEEASHIQVSDDSEYSYQIRRSISNAFSFIKNQLADYLDDNISVADNLLKEAVDSDGQLTLQLIMPSNFNLSATDNIGAAIHAYIVNRAIADWFIISDKEDAADYTSLAAEALESAKRALCKRKRPVRPSFDNSNS